MTLWDSLPDRLVNPRAPAIEVERFSHLVGEPLICPQAAIGLNPIGLDPNARYLTRSASTPKSSLPVPSCSLP
jgi:hypothetical protein